MISPQLEFVFNQAIKKANLLRHEFVTIENLLIELLKDQQIDEVISRVSPKKNISTELITSLESFLEEEKHFSILSDQEIEELGKEQFTSQELREVARESGIFFQPEISMAVQRSMQRAAIHIQSSGKKSILPIHLLLSLYGEKDSHGIYTLLKNGIEKHKIVELIAHSQDRPITDSGDDSFFHENQEKGGEDKALEEFTVNLSEKARSGELDPVIGREEELERALQILMRRKKNNPLFVGEAGVGKTALAHGIAQKLQGKNIPQNLMGVEVFSLDMTSLMAGAKFRGDFEERLKRVVKALKNIKNPNGSLLFIDEIHTIVGAGATGGGSLDASNLLKPALSDGSIKCMGSTTYDEYKKHFEKDAALNRRFQKIDILEPNIEETKKIIQGIKEYFEKHHQVVYSQDIIKELVELSQKHLTGAFQPDKSIDVLDEVGAYVRLKKDFQTQQKISSDDVQTVIAKMARIPKKSVSSEEREKLKNLQRELSLLIFGQDQAIEKVVDAVMLSRSGLTESNKPIASFLFVGPTGVGKTELAKQLAFSLGVNFSRFDMSEYMEKHSVSKLIGAPPGYVGHEDGGKLTEAVNKNPYGVLLLDEIEKAHPDILNVLLQVMDYGKMTDSQGRVSDFRNSIIIMTSNAGASELEQGGIGISNQKLAGVSKQDKVLKNFFSPEFRNRLDGIIPFVKLKEGIVKSIVEKFLFQLIEKVESSGFEVEYQKEIIDWIAKEAYSPTLGARPIGRFSEERIKKPLAKMILFAKEKEGGKIKIEKSEDNILIFWS